MSKTNDTPEKILAEVSGFIAESQSLLQQGAMMELAGLDDRVRFLCSKVLELSQEDRVRYADQLHQVLIELKGLGDALVAQRDAIAEAIRNLSDHKKASVAYQTADAVHPNKDKKKK